MSDLRKAAEMALEFTSWFTRDDHSIRPKYKAPEIAEALRQALAQPEEKMRIEGSGKLTTKPYPDGYESERDFRKALAQPKQEPVAWMNNDYEVFFDAGKAACYSMGWIKPLYTTPPKREWAGLTDEEKQEIVRQEVHWSGICRAIEDKLKEKNT